MNRARILFVQPNSEVGGSDLALLRLVASINLSDYEPIVALPRDGPLVPRLRAAGATVHFIPMMQLRTLPSLRYQTLYLAHFWSTVARLVTTIRIERIDLVHTNSLYTFYGALAAWLSGRPHIWHIREIPPQVPVARAALGWMVLSLSRLVLSMTQACSCGLFANPQHRKIRLLAEGLDFSIWTRRPSHRNIRGELGIDPKAPVVGFVARLDPWKGLDVFLDAMALVHRKVPDAVFLVSGDAPEGFESYRDKMVARAASSGIGQATHFLGWRYRMDDIPHLMANLDVFCHTSITPEPFGLVVIEAMAIGCPVVSVSAGGPLEIIERGKSGLLTPPGDAATLAEAVCGLLADPAARRRYADAGRARVEERYAKATFTREIADVYATVLRGRTS